jgi:hypothetical protein
MDEPIRPVPMRVVIRGRDVNRSSALLGTGAGGLGGAALGIGREGNVPAEPVSE